MKTFYAPLAKSSLFLQSTKARRWRAFTKYHLGSRAYPAFPLGLGSAGRRALIPLALLLALAACASTEQVAQAPVQNTVSPADSAAVLPYLKALYPDAIESPQVPPEPEGGYRNMLMQIRYPMEALRAGVQGRVYVRFVVDESGKVLSPTVVRGIGEGCDEEAVRVISATKFAPGRHEGKSVKVLMGMPVSFRFRTQN